MNLVQSARKRILNGNFLTEDELSQEQYTLVTDPNASAESILKLHDKLFGSHFSNIPKNLLDQGPFFCEDVEIEEEILQVVEGDDEGGSNEVGSLTPALV